MFNYPNFQYIFSFFLSTRFIYPFVIIAGGAKQRMTNNSKIRSIFFYVNIWFIPNFAGILHNLLFHFDHWSEKIAEHFQTFTSYNIYCSLFVFYFWYIFSSKMIFNSSTARTIDKELFSVWKSATNWKCENQTQTNERTQEQMLCECVFRRTATGCARLYSEHGSCSEWFEILKIFILAFHNRIQFELSHDGRSGLKKSSSESSRTAIARDMKINETFWIKFR